MIVATIGEKGGGGKSTVAYHFLTAYFFSKDHDGNDLYVYEFDAHNNTGYDFREDKLILPISVPDDTEAMVEAIAEIEYKASEGQNIIIDVGGSDNTDRFLSLIEDTFLASEVVFVIPEMNKKPRSAVNTIEKIRNISPEADIIVALNRWSGAKSKKEEFKFFYGDDKLGLEASELASDESILVAPIPVCDVAIGIAETSALSLWKVSENIRYYGNLPINERKEMWGSASSEGKDKNSTCSEEVFVRETKKLHASKLAHHAIKGAEELFEHLESIAKKKSHE